MNLKHGFYSKNTAFNPDCRAIGCVTPTSEDLAFTEGFLYGDDCADPVRAHNIVKAIFLGGKRKYPTLWDKSNLYVNGYEYATLEKLANLVNKEDNAMKNDVQQTKTVYDLLLQSPAESVSTVQAAWKSVAAGDWLEASKHLGYAAEHGETDWHDECQTMADGFRAKAQALA